MQGMASFRVNLVAKRRDLRHWTSHTALAVAFYFDASDLKTSIGEFHTWSLNMSIRSTQKSIMLKKQQKIDI